MRYKKEYFTFYVVEKMILSLHLFFSAEAYTVILTQLFNLLL